MTEERVADVVRNVICEKFHIKSSEVLDGYYLWDDLEADDLDFIEIFSILEEALDHGGFDSLDLDHYRRLTVKEFIHHIESAICSVTEIV